MVAENRGPLLGTNIIDSAYWAFQQGATIGNAVVTGNRGSLMVAFGIWEWDSTFNNLGPGVAPLVF